MTAHLDLFVQQHLPAQEELPDFINLENFDYPEILNCATPLLDDAVKEGYGSKEVVLMNEGSWTYSDLQKDSNQIARVLLEDLNMKPGNRSCAQGTQQLPNVCRMVWCHQSRRNSGFHDASFAFNGVKHHHQQSPSFHCAMRH